MNTQYIPISSWAEDERPREKLLSKGVTTLSVNELLAILFRSGSGGESALDLARHVLADYNNDLNALACAEVHDLMNRYKGMGMAKASALIAAFELGRRRSLANVSQVQTLTSSRDVYDYLRFRMGDLDHEEFWVLLLDNACHVKGCERLFWGGMEGVLVDVRVLFRKALEAKARSIIIAHNHPSGNLNPSKEDVCLTQKVREGGKTLDISLLDHLIVGMHGFYSFADEGKL